MHSNTFKFKVHGICTSWWNDALGVWVVLSVSVDTGTMHISNMTLQNSKKWTNEKKHWILNYIDRELKKVTSGACNFLGSVSPQQKFEATNGPVLQLNFIWQAKVSTPLKCEGGLTPKEKPQSILASSFYTFVPSLSLLLSLLYTNWGGQEGGVLVSSEVLILVLGFSFVSFSGAFLFLF